MMMRKPKVGVVKMMSKAYVCEIINHAKEEGVPYENNNGYLPFAGWA